jgi:hypothetical protein
MVVVPGMRRRIRLPLRLTIGDGLANPFIKARCSRIAEPFGIGRNGVSVRGRESLVLCVEPGCKEIALLLGGGDAPRGRVVPKSLSMFDRLPIGKQNDHLVRVFTRERFDLLRVGHKRAICVPAEHTGFDGGWKRYGPRWPSDPLRRSAHGRIIALQESNFGKWNQRLIARIKFWIVAVLSMRRHCERIVLPELKLPHLPELMSMFHQLERGMDTLPDSAAI